MPMSQTSQPDLISEYLARTAGSREYHTSACQYLPGGETRSITHYDPYPVVIAEGHGALLLDIDGNEYVDVLNNYTSLVHGHAFGPVVEAVRAVLPSGTAFPAPHKHQLSLARTLVERYPAVERVRFTNSGTEAAMLALRIARAATGRRRVMMFSGGYHGSVPDLVDGGADTILAPYNDADRTVAAIDDSVAAVFAEPFLGTGGVIPATPEFLHAACERVRSAGGLFVLDEVQSLRNQTCGVHASIGLEPDLVLMGKIIGGGFPVGAVGGGASLMDRTSAARPGGLSCSGTFNGNVITMAAGSAALAVLDEPAIRALNGRAEALAGQIESAASRAGVPCSVSRSGSILHAHLLDRLPETAADVQAVPAEWTSALHLALLLEGVYSAPRGMLNLSTALDEAQLARVADGYACAFARIRDLVTGRALLVPGAPGDQRR
jgi:glutamate-1-semialdehyde 2,1-aminomutase